LSDFSSLWLVSVYSLWRRITSAISRTSRLWSRLKEWLVGEFSARTEQVLYDFMCCWRSLPAWFVTQHLQDWCFKFRSPAAKKRSPWHPSRVFTSFINKGVLELLHIDVRRICLPPCFNIIVVKSREVSTSSHLCTMFLRISMAVLPSGCGWVVLGSICWWSIGEVVWNLEYSWLSF